MCQGMSFCGPCQPSAAVLAFSEARTNNLPHFGDRAQEGTARKRRHKVLETMVRRGRHLLNANTPAGLAAEIEAERRRVMSGRVHRRGFFLTTDRNRAFRRWITKNLVEARALILNEHPNPSQQSLAQVFGVDHLISSTPTRELEPA